MQEFSPQGDDGLTIVELLIALTIVMITFAALASTIFATFAGIRSNESRVRATAIANEAIEEMAVMPWEVLGLHRSDADLMPKYGSVPLADGEEYESEPLALFDDATDVPPHEETVTTEVDGLSYSIERWVTFVAQDGTLFDDGTSDLKRMGVIVSWDVSGTERSVRVEGLRGPDPNDLLSLRVRFLEFESVNSDPDRVALALSAGEYLNDDAFTALVEVGEVDSTVTLEFEDRNGDAKVLTTSPPPEGFTVTREFPVAEGAFEFPHGAVTFTVRAVSPDGDEASNVATMRFFETLDVFSTAVLHDGPGAPDPPLPVCSDGGSYFIDGDVTIDTEIWGVSPSEAGRSLPAQPDMPSIRVEWDPALLPLAHTDATETVHGGLYDFVADAGTVEVAVGQTEVPFVLHVARVVDQAGIRVVEEPTDGTPLEIALSTPIDDWPDGAPGDPAFDAAIPACGTP